MPAGAGQVGANAEPGGAWSARIAAPACHAIRMPMRSLVACMLGVRTAGLILQSDYGPPGREGAGAG